MKLIDLSAAELREKLQEYLRSDPRYRAVHDFTRQQFDGAPQLPAHNWEHVFRDVLNAIVIGEAEGADMRIVLPATTMHDIGFLYGADGRTHGAVGAEKLAEFLQEGGITYSPAMTAEIASCIRTHKGSMHDEKPEGLEAKVVSDADMVEKFGPIGVYQNIRVSTEFNRPLEQVLKRATEISALTLQTETGRRIAEPGRRFVAMFYEQLTEATRPYAVETS